MNIYPSNENWNEFITYKDEDRSFQCGIAFQSILENGKLSQSTAKDIVNMLDSSRNSELK